MDQHHKVQRRRDKEESPDGRSHKDHKKKKKKKKDHRKSHKHERHKNSHDSDSSQVDIESRRDDKSDRKKSRTNHSRHSDDKGRNEASSSKPRTLQGDVTGRGNQDHRQENYRKLEESSKYKRNRSESSVDSDNMERYKGEQSDDMKKHRRDKYRRDDVISSHTEKKTDADSRYREKRPNEEIENTKTKHRKSDRSEELRTKESSYHSEADYKHSSGKLESSRGETHNKRYKYKPDDLADGEKRDIRQRLDCEHTTKHKGENESRYKRGQCDDSSADSSSDSEAEGSDDEQTSPDFDFDWERHRRQLSEVFFKDNYLIRKGSEAYEDFWAFVKKYQMFQRRKSMQAVKKKQKKKEKTEGQLDIPEKYDKRYRINLSFVTKDLDVYLRQGIRKGEGPSELTSERLLQFRQIILYYLDFIQKQKFSRLLKLRQDQQNLPIYQYKEKIVEMVRAHQVVVVAGDTGCGKSTQVPQYLLEAGFKNIACTQPRRIACISLSKRVGYETLNEYGSEVAYQVRFEKTKTKSTRILFLTEGLLLRQVQSDGRLSQYDVIVIDEVHERHIHTDFLLGVLKCMLHQRADLKLVLMSATINIHLFSSYFSDCPVVKVPGRLYPIQLEYCPLSLEDMAERTGKLDPRPYLRIMQKIDHKYPETERGDLLIFLSGMSEIMSVVEAGRMYAQESKKWIILPLHSALSIEEQDKVFDISPEGVRKCIVSTNIAETSVTIDGVRFIVDSGKVKEMNFDSKTKLQRLQEFWISQASAEQRKGRAGRTGPGVCFRLYDESDFHEFQEYSTPEIQRVALDSLILQMVAMGLPDARKFPFLEAPSESSIENSIVFLKDQGAITGDEKLTPIGEMLAQLPVDVVMGKMLIMGSIFHMMDPVLSISAALSVQSPFTNKGRIDLDVMTQRRPLESDHGDPFTLLNTFDEWIQVKAEGRGTKKWCRRRGLEEQRFYEMSKLKQQFRQLLREHNMLEGEHESQRYMSREERRQRHKDQQKLRVMRREERNKGRKRKMLKLEEEDFELSDWDAEPEEEGGQDVKDLEFRITNDLSQMQEKSNKSRSFTLRDINLLKVILCSGLYPQIGIADEHNSYKSDSDQLFHTKGKPFVMLHPTSVFTSHPDLLELKQKDIKEKGHRDSREPFSNRHQLVSYVTLLETTKPFLTGVMRVPALQTLLLYAHSLDTNTDLTRVVCDGWLELRFEDPDTAEQLISSVVQLRVNWQNLIKMKLQDTFARSVDGDKTPETSTRYKARRLERVLATKLTEFLESDVVYTVRRVLAAELEHLYKGPEDDKKEEHKILKDLFASSGDPHPVKGGIQVNSFLTYDCLHSDATASVWGEYTSYMQKHWTCPRCQQSLIVTVVERLQHEQQCGTDSKEATESSGDAALDQSADNQSDGLEHLRKPYHCPTCDTDYKFTATEILKHKKSCKP